MSDYRHSIPLSGGCQDLLGDVTSVTTYNKNEAISSMPKIASNGLGDTVSFLINYFDPGDTFYFRTITYQSIMDRDSLS